MNYSELGAALRTMRESSGKSREELAQVLGCTRGAVAHYEGGRRKIPIDLIDAWATFCGNHLVLGFRPVADELSTDRDQVERALRVLDSADRALVIRLARALPGHEIAREGLARQIEVLERFGGFGALKSTGRDPALG